MFKLINRIVAFAVMFCLVFEQSGFAQVAPDMNIPAYLNGLVGADKFRPMHMRWLSYDSINNSFDLAVEKGDDARIKEADIQKSTAKIMEYFQIGLRLPDSMFWVNLRPDAPDQIIDPYLARTDIGKIMLEADLQLKKDLARFTSPDTKAGREYWNKLYARAEQLFGDQDISIPTVTRPWIIPNEIIIKEYKDGAYVYKATMKVMLEQDYLKDAPGYNFDDPRLQELNNYSSDLVRQLIIPQLTREVNSSKRYSGLRQVFYSLVLSQWFKQRYAQREGQQGSALTDTIDSRDLSGLASKTAWSKDRYFNQYVQSFQKGEYNKQETINGSYGMTVRQYFSGGILFPLKRGAQSLMTILPAAQQSQAPAMLNVIGDANRYILDFNGAVLNIKVLPTVQDLQAKPSAQAKSPLSVLTASAAASKDGGTPLTDAVKAFLQDIRDFNGTIDQSWVRAMLGRHGLLDHYDGFPVFGVRDEIVAQSFELNPLKLESVKAAILGLNLDHMELLRDGSIRNDDRKIARGMPQDARIRDFLQDVTDFNGTIDKNWVRAVLGRHGLLDSLNYGVPVAQVAKAVLAVYHAHYSSKIGDVNNAIHSLTLDAIVKNRDRLHKDGGSNTLSIAGRTALSAGAMWFSGATSIVVAGLLAIIFDMNDIGVALIQGAFDAGIAEAIMYPLVAGALISAAVTVKAFLEGRGSKKEYLLDMASFLEIVGIIVVFIFVETTMQSIGLMTHNSLVFQLSGIPLMLAYLISDLAAINFLGHQAQIFRDGIYDHFTKSDQGRDDERDTGDKDGRFVDDETDNFRDGGDVKVSPLKLIGISGVSAFAFFVYLYVLDQTFYSAVGGSAVIGMLTALIYLDYAQNTDNVKSSKDGGTELVDKAVKKKLKNELIGFMNEYNMKVAEIAGQYAENIQNKTASSKELRVLLDSASAQRDNLLESVEALLVKQIKAAVRGSLHNFDEIKEFKTYLKNAEFNTDVMTFLLGAVAFVGAILTVGYAVSLPATGVEFTASALTVVIMGIIAYEASRSSLAILEVRNVIDKIDAQEWDMPDVAQDRSQQDGGTSREDSIIFLLSNAVFAMAKRSAIITVIVAAFGSVLMPYNIMAWVAVVAGTAVITYVGQAVFYAAQFAAYTSRLFRVDTVGTDLKKGRQAMRRWNALTDELSRLYGRYGSITDYAARPPSGVRPNRLVKEATRALWKQSISEVEIREYRLFLKNRVQDLKAQIEMFLGACALSGILFVSFSSQPMLAIYAGVVGAFFAGAAIWKALQSQFVQYADLLVRRVQYHGYAQPDTWAESDSTAKDGGDIAELAKRINEVKTKIKGIRAKIDELSAAQKGQDKKNIKKIEQLLGLKKDEEAALRDLRAQLQATMVEMVNWLKQDFRNKKLGEFNKALAGIDVCLKELRAQLNEENADLKIFKYSAIAVVLESLRKDRITALTERTDYVTLSKLAGKLIDIVDEKGNVLAVADEGIAHMFGLRHRAVYAFVFGPNGEVVLPRRMPDGFEARPISAFGGHVDSQDKIDDVMRQKLLEGLQLAGFEQGLQGRLFPIGESGQFTYDIVQNSDTSVLSIVNNEFRALFAYFMTPEEFNIVRGRRAFLNDEVRAQKTFNEFEQWVNAPEVKEKGLGPVWNYLFISYDAFKYAVSNGRNAILTEERYRDRLESSRVPFSSALNGIISSRDINAVTPLNELEELLDVVRTGDDEEIAALLEGRKPVEEKPTIGNRVREGLQALRLIKNTTGFLKTKKTDDTSKDGGEDQLKNDLETWETRLLKVEDREHAVVVANAMRGMAALAMMSNRLNVYTSSKMKELYNSIGPRSELRIMALTNSRTAVGYYHNGVRKLVVSTFPQKNIDNSVISEYRVDYEGTWKVYLLQDSKNVVLFSPVGKFLLERGDKKYEVNNVWYLAPADPEPEPEPKPVTALVVVQDQNDGGTTFGGVDFRAMPAVVMPAAAPAVGQIAPVAAVDVKELDRLWASLQAKVRGGQMPYEDIRAYITACCANNEACESLKKASLWVSEILKMEEDACVATSAQMKEVIALL